MRLRPLTPSLPIDLQPLIALLARPPLSLHTTEALLFAGISGDSPGHTDAKIASHLPADSGFSARDVARLRKEALKLDSGAGGGEDDSWFAGDAAFREEKQQRAMIQAAGVAFGVRELDGLVTGRAGRGVIEVYGHERGGKTLLALHAALEQLHRDPKCSVLWIDTEGQFEAGRAAEALKLKYPLTDPQSILSRLQVLVAFDRVRFVEVLAGLEGLIEGSSSFVDDVGNPAALPQGDSSSVPALKLSLLVVDPITPLYTDTISHASSEGRAALHAHLSHLSLLSTLLPFSTLLTSTVRSSITTAAPLTDVARLFRAPPPTSTTSQLDWPSLGSTMDYLSDVRLSVELVGRGPGVGIVRVVKTRGDRGPSASWSAFFTNGVSLVEYSGAS